jgi:hypothetical protein
MTREKDCCGRNFGHDSDCPERDEVIDNHPRIQSITVQLGEDGEESTWSVGDMAQINNFEHKDHGERGVVIAFQVIATHPSDVDDDGIVCPVLDIGRRVPAVVFPIPFHKLIKLEI